MKRIRQSVELGVVNQGDRRSPTFYDHCSPVMTGNRGYHSRHHSLVSTSTPGSRPVRPPSFSNYSNTFSHNVPSSVSSYYSKMIQSVPSRSFTFRQPQRPQQQEQEYLQPQPLTPPATITMAASSYTIDALATAATSQISAERYHESTSSTLASPLFSQTYNNNQQADVHGNVQTTGASNTSVPAVSVGGMTVAAYASPLPPPPPPLPQSQHSQHSQQSQSSSYSGNSHHSHYSPSVADMQYRMETMNPHNDEAAIMRRDAKQLQVCMGES